jgi:hypothetical protein
MEDLRDVPQMKDPLGELERRIMDEYLRDAGHDPHALRARTDAMARSLLVDAATYAAMRVTEVEARSHYVRNLHGQE